MGLSFIELYESFMAQGGDPNMSRAGGEAFGGSAFERWFPLNV